MGQPQISIKPVFVKAEAMFERFYCGRCLYGGEDKYVMMNTVPKPKDTKCYKGSAGYYLGEASIKVNNA